MNPHDIVELAFGAIVLAALIRNRHMNKDLASLMEAQGALLATVAGQTSVIAGAVAYIRSHTKTVDDVTAALDTALSSGDLAAIAEANDALKAANVVAKANTVAVAEALAANTESSSEVHEDKPGGTGDEDSVVEAPAADAPLGDAPTEPPIPAVEPEPQDPPQS